AAKTDKTDKTKVPVVESQPPPSVTPSKGVTEPSKNVTEKSPPTIEPATTMAPSLPRDFWYALLGTLFTCILAPIVVMLVKERMKSGREVSDANEDRLPARPCRSKS